MGDDDERPEAVTGELVASDSARSEAAEQARYAGLRPFKPGQSGNPAGTSKLSRQLRDYIAGPAGKKTKEDVDAIRTLASTARSEFVRLEARRWLAEQVIGKASQPLDIRDPETGEGVRYGIIVMPTQRSDDDE